jgi:hypothetical protein
MARFSALESSLTEISGRFVGAASVSAMALYCRSRAPAPGRRKTAKIGLVGGSPGTLAPGIESG